MVDPYFTEFNKKESSFDSLCKRYVDFVKQNVGPVVVFDGYGNGPSTKDSSDSRTKGIVGSKIRGFSGNKLLMTTKENFLSNETNKSNFILLLKQHLESRGVRTKQATGDADCLISETGIHLNYHGPSLHVLLAKTQICLLFYVIAQIVLAR